MEETTAEYLILIYGDEAGYDAMSQSELHQVMEGWLVETRQ